MARNRISFYPKFDYKHFHLYKKDREYRDEIFFHYKSNFCCSRCLGFYKYRIITEKVVNVSFKRFYYSITNACVHLALYDK